MNKIKLVALSTLFFSGLASAEPACSGFELKLKNNLADDLIITNISLDGADISPTGLQKINSKSEEVFVINKTTANVRMTGKFVLHTLSLPNKTININYTLENKGAVCEHSQIESDSDLPVSKTRGINHVVYTINP